MQCRLFASGRQTGGLSAPVPQRFRASARDLAEVMRDLAEITRDHSPIAHNQRAVARDLALVHALVSRNEARSEQSRRAIVTRLRATSAGMRATSARIRMTFDELRPTSRRPRAICAEFALRMAPDMRQSTRGREQLLAGRRRSSRGHALPAHGRPLTPLSSAHDVAFSCESAENLRTARHAIPGISDAEGAPSR
jgi:hypothetical protein